MHDPGWSGLLEMVCAGRAGDVQDAVVAGAARLTCLAPRPAWPYGRRLLHRTDLGEVMLASWPEDGRALPHDHGDARGLVLVVSGKFVEQTFAFAGCDLSLRSRRELGPGDWLRVAPDAIHDLAALQGGLTCHLYVPPIPRMRVYDARSRSTLLVSGESGAWIPDNPRLVLAREPWA